MDQQTVSKETLVALVRQAVTHVNRNLYEWTSGTKKGKIQFVITHSEVKGLVRGWLIRLLRDKIGYADSDRLLKGVYVSMDADNACIKSISLCSYGRSSRFYGLINDILSSIDYSKLRYDPKDYLMDGMSERKPGFDPFFFVSFEDLKSFSFKH